MVAASFGAPDLLILDEPTIGLDPQQRVHIRKVLKTDLAPSILLSTHLLEDVIHLADRIIVFNKGSIIFDGNLHKLESLGANTPEKEMNAAEAGYLSLLEGVENAES